MVIDISNNHMVSVFVTDDREVILHCQVMTWGPKLKKRLLKIIDSIGTCYSIITEKEMKFNEIMGGKCIGTISGEYVMRFN